MNHLKEKKSPKSRPLKLQKKCSPRICRYRLVPELRLSGIWLEQAGFEIGQMVEIKISKNLLTIKVKSS